jgi:hypothetical protein
MKQGSLSPSNNIAIFHLQQQEHKVMAHNLIRRLQFPPLPCYEKNEIYEHI